MSTATQNNEFETSAGVLWDDPEAGKTWLVSLISVIIFSATVIALSVMYFQTEQTEVDIKVIEPQYIALETLTMKQKELLRSSGSYSVDVVGKPVTRERIPVEQAIKMVAQNPALTLPSASAKQPSAAPAPAPTVPVTKSAATPAAVAPA
ncbi:MAG: hypothetical protein WCO75_09450, partial [Planctomycetota bacterium]